MTVAGLVEWAAYQSPPHPAMWNGGVTPASFQPLAFGLSGFMGQFGSMAPTCAVSYELFYYLLWPSC